MDYDKKSFWDRNKEYCSRKKEKRREEEQRRREEYQKKILPIKDDLEVMEKKIRTEKNYHRNQHLQREKTSLRLVLMDLLHAFNLKEELIKSKF